MKLIYTFFIAAAVCILCNTTTIYGNVQYYSYGQGKVTFTKVQTQASYYMHVAGKTTLGLIVFNIQKPGMRAFKVYPEIRNGKFKTTFLFMKGPGRYSIQVFGHPSKRSRQFYGLCYFSVRASRSVPKRVIKKININKKIIRYVNRVKGTRVGRGECWDLAQKALDLHGATWWRTKLYGKLINPNKDEILPGDIIQFYRVRTKRRFPGGKTRYTTMGSPDHTAIIYKVYSNKKFKIAHQNTRGRRYVVFDTINMKYKISGRYWIYRPLPGLVKLSELR